MGIMKIFKRSNKLKVKEFGKLLYDFTFDERAFQSLKDKLSGVEGLDIEIVRTEFIFLVMIIIELLLFSGFTIKRFKGLNKEIFLMYLYYIKNESVFRDDSDNSLLKSIDVRHSKYNDAIKKNMENPENNSFIEIGEIFAEYCDKKHNLYLIMAITMEFGVLISTIRKTIESYEVY